MKKVITDINQLDFSKKYTYADYLTWQFEEMVELIRGRIFKMSPAPNTRHQKISRNLLLGIGPYLQKKKCQVFHAPFDVRLALPPQLQTTDKINTVVQPDISIICDPHKIDDKGCNGAPYWIIEILSKGTADKDLTEKYDIYMHSGVQEYWIVNPDEDTVLPYRLDENEEYCLIRDKPFVKGEKVPVGIFPGFQIDLEEIFD